jgi:hypothetical protein
VLSGTYIILSLGKRCTVLDVSIGNIRLSIIWNIYYFISWKETYCTVCTCCGSASLYTTIKAYLLKNQNLGENAQLSKTHATTIQGERFCPPYEYSVLDVIPLRPSSHKHAPLFEGKNLHRNQKTAYVPAAFLCGILQVSIRISNNYTKK